jgi:hypothetical protein
MLFRRLWPLLRSRFGRFYLIATLLFGSLDSRRSLIMSRLAIIGLLEIPLLLPTGRRHVVVAPWLFGRTLVLTEIARLVVVTAVVLWSTRFPNYIAYWAGCEIATGRAFYRINAGPAVFKNRALAAADINCLPAEIINHFRPIDNRGVVHDEIASAAKMILEVMNIAEREK